MTQEDLNEYNKLSPNEKDIYNMGMRQHPDWSHAQAMTFVAVVVVTIDPPDPPTTMEMIKEFYKQTVMRAQIFIETNFPRVYQQVRDTFKKVIDWLTNAVNVTLNKILDFFR